MFDDPLRAAIDATKLRDVQRQIEGAGAVIRREAPKATNQGSMVIVTIRIVRSAAALDATIAVDASGRVSGLNFQNAPPKASASDPSTPAIPGVREEVLEIRREGMRPLPASLTRPLARLGSEGGMPGVVLVHGSGPHDRDSRVGDIALFRDLAAGLSRAGIAVLRYEKRTRVDPAAYQDVDFTVDDEVTKDAVAAIKTLKTAEGVDSEKLYVLGHSLGGALAPRIAARSGDVAGVILLAAPARTLIALLSEQVRTLSEADGTVDERERTQLAAIDSMADLAAQSEDRSAEGIRLMGAPFSYWKSLQDLTPIADLTAFGGRALLVRGDADGQVPTEDWSRWMAAFDHVDRVTLRTFPGLDHFGAVASTETNLGSKRVERHVDARLIDGIAEWIKGSFGQGE